ncbi:hypothetical protein [Halobellus ordinarius]|uniref:hypothetical protein n=1 Tax=Halobellus ordinarius TaxID=3075120 RepID=UPI0028807D27|nr:hypothetical protein [Halobellus sp. ZY16]
MSQEYATSSQLPDDVDGTLEGSTHEDSSSRLERFGLGVAASILLGAVVGVAATAVLDAGAVPLLFATGMGFLLSPVIGVLVLERNE